MHAPKHTREQAKQQKQAEAEEQEEEQEGDRVLEPPSLDLLRLVQRRSGCGKLAPVSLELRLPHAARHNLVRDALARDLTPTTPTTTTTTTSDAACRNRGCGSFVRLEHWIQHAQTRQPLVSQGKAQQSPPERDAPTRGHLRRPHPHTEKNPTRR